MYQWTKFWSIWRISDFGTKLAQKIWKTKVLKKVNIKIHKWCQVYCTKVGCRMRLCQEIKWFWRTLSFLNIIVIRWNFGARNEILSFAFLLFLWDNALQKLRIPLHSWEGWSQSFWLKLFHVSKKIPMQKLHCWFHVSKNGIHVDNFQKIVFSQIFK